MNRGNRTIARRVAAITLAALGALAAALAIGGPFTLVVTAECLAALALLVALARTPTGVRERGAPRAAAWARARDLVGDDIWPLVDPSRPPSFDSKAPGADLRALTRIVDRLEQL